MTKSILGVEPFDEIVGDHEWEIMIMIPKSIFTFDNLESFTNLKASANFYKCGDKTKWPHYFSWNPIELPQPNFQRPEFFGSIYFE